ncbi:hypothetical protein MTO96_000614 [Rhipicephalus appendiculatus]
MTETRPNCSVPVWLEHPTQRPSQRQVWRLGQSRQGSADSTDPQLKAQRSLRPSQMTLPALVSQSLGFPELKFHALSCQFQKWLPGWTSELPYWQPYRHQTELS